MSQRKLPITVTGLWWIPGNRRWKTRGSLHISEQGKARLDIESLTKVGWLPDATFVDPQSAVAEVPAVHGLINDAEISLLDCQLQITNLYQGKRVSYLLADSVILGSWAVSKDEPIYDSVRVELEYLAAWRAASVFSIPEPDSALGSGSIVVAVPPTLRARTTSESVELHLGIHTESKTTPSGTMKVSRETAIIAVASDALMTAQDGRNQARRYQDLISLAAGRSSAILSVVLMKKRSRSRKFYDEGLSDFYFPTIVKPAPDNRPMVYQQMAFSPEGMDFAALIDEWPKLQERFAGPLAALLGFRYSGDQYVENRVVILMAALEEAYRALGLNEMLVESQSQVRKVQQLTRKALGDSDKFASVAKELAQQIDGRAALGKRLTELAEFLDVIDTLFGGQENFGRWIAAAKISRNSLAHTGSDPDGEISKLAAIAYGAEALVELAILKGLGMGQEKLQEVVRLRYLRVPWWIEKHIPMPS